MPEILLDTIIDNVKLFPFLFITYLFLEYFEHKTSAKLIKTIKKSGNTGPLVGSLLGAIPQCGFSVAAVNFYAAHIISLGTLIAIFLSTSDEVLPIFISSGLPMKTIVIILCYKIVCGILGGYLLNGLYPLHKNAPIDIEKLCQNEHCHCDRSILQPALWHSIRIAIFIFIVTFIINCLFSYIEPHKMTNYLQKPFWGEVLSGFFGFIPNCSASVVLAQLYLEKCINIGTFMSGSLVNAGVGILVLFRVNKNMKENIKILVILYIFGVFFGLICNLIPCIHKLLSV